MGPRKVPAIELHFQKLANLPSSSTKVSLQLQLIDGKDGPAFGSKRRIPGPGSGARNVSWGTKGKAGYCKWDRIDSHDCAVLIEVHDKSAVIATAFVPLNDIWAQREKTAWVVLDPVKDGRHEGKKFLAAASRGSGSLGVDEGETIIGGGRLFACVAFDCAIALTQTQSSCLHSSPVVENLPDEINEAAPHFYETQELKALEKEKRGPFDQIEVRNPERSPRQKQAGLTESQGDAKEEVTYEPLESSPLPVSISSPAPGIPSSAVDPPLERELLSSQTYVSKLPELDCPEYHFESGCENLPPGWEGRRLPDNTLYFVDHINRTTTNVDPRSSNSVATTQRPADVHVNNTASVTLRILRVANAPLDSRGKEPTVRVRTQLHDSAGRPTYGTRKKTGRVGAARSIEIGEDFVWKRLDENDTDVHIEIYDTAGSNVVLGEFWLPLRYLTDDNSTHVEWVVLPHRDGRSVSASSSELADQASREPSQFLFLEIGLLLSSALTDGQKASVHYNPVILPMLPPGLLGTHFATRQELKEGASQDVLSIAATGATNTPTIAGADSERGPGAVTDPLLGHVFLDQYFSKPTTCAICKKMVMGLTAGQQKGCRCSQCKADVHRKCVFNLSADNLSTCPLYH